MNHLRPLGCFLVLVGLLVPPRLAQVPDPGQCLVSGIYNLVRLPDSKTGLSCWQDCSAEADCHMAVVSSPPRGPDQCLLLDCLNRTQYSRPRDPSAKIAVYPKSTLDQDQWKLFLDGHGHGHGFADETSRCFDFLNASLVSGCSSGVPRFFYNQTSFRCERFLSGCSSSRNSFSSQEACGVLCSEKYLCYRPVQYGQRPPSRFLDDPSANDELPNFFFYNSSSCRCERFHFRGSESNGNMFHSEDDCERLCGDVSETRGKTAPSQALPSHDSGLLSSVVLVLVLILVLVVVLVAVIQYYRLYRRRSSVSDGMLLLPYTNM